MKKAATRELLALRVDEKNMVKKLYEKAKNQLQKVKKKGGEKSCAQVFTVEFCNF